MKIRPIAFVLPQFHPIPENDEWWGKGFTEWTNVTKAKPLYPGHYQPQLPTDLGYYDLRLPESREAQASLAKEYNIFGFCYYHYWFNGKQLLNRPLEEMIKLKEPDFPFMLCWANENWTRKWDGENEHILIEQHYNYEDDKNHIRWLCKNVFNDDRYIKIKGKPVFLIYREDLFPNIQKTLKIWRGIAMEEFGFEGLYLCVLESFNRKINPKKLNFDAVVEFSPHQVIKHDLRLSIVERLLKKRKGFQKDYKRAVKESLNRPVPDYKLYRSVTPSFDNTPRRQEWGVISRGSSPQIYFNWLKKLVKKFQPYSSEENFIFINAMNEWAEGNHLEPCIKYGLEYLEATKEATKSC